MMIKKLNLNKTFYKFLLAFMSIIILSLLSYIYFYVNAKELMSKNIIESGLLNISNTGADLDRNIYDIYKLIYNIRTDSSVEEYSKAEQIPFYEYSLLQRAIIKNMTANEAVEDVLLYLRDDDIIISKEGSFSFDTYFDKYMINSSKNKYFWRDYLGKSSKLEVFPEEVYSSTDNFKTTNSDVLLIFSAGKLNYANISLVVLVNKCKLAKIAGEDVIIIDPNGNLITNLSSVSVDTNLIMQHLKHENTTDYEAMNLGGIKQYVFYNKSSNYMWYYIKLIPHSNIYKALYDFNRIAVIVIIFLMITTVLLSYVYSVSLYKPIKRLVDLVKHDSSVNCGQQQGKSEIQRVLYYIQSIYSNYETVERKNKMLQEFNKEYFYERLIKNRDISRYESILSELNIAPEDFEHIRIVNFRICLKSHASDMLNGSADATDKLVLAIKEVIGVTLESMNYNYYCFDTDVNLRTVILPLKKSFFDQQLFFSKVREILENDKEYFYIVMSISQDYRGIEKISSAYSEALDIIQYQTLKEENQFLSESERKSVNYSKVIREISNKLYVMTDTGRFECLNELLTELLQLYQSNEISLFHIKSDLSIIFKSLYEKTSANPVYAEQVDTIIKKIGKSITKDDFNIVLDDITNLLCTKSESDNKHNSSQTVIESMVKYIEMNYYEDISLDFFSSRYKMNSIYLSKIFKDVTGTNYIEFVIKLRMDHAKKMLLESDMKVKDISLKVGYRDPNTFNKVFKKHYDISPGEFRKYAISKQLD